MKAILQRDHKASDKVVFGKLYLPWIKVHPDIYTIELPWKDNAPHISCIPAGIYTLIPFNSSKHGNTWKFQNVTNRSNCELHSANFACDVFWNGQQRNCELEGCAAPGFGIDEDVPMLQRSKEAMDYLRTTIGINSTWQVEIKD